MTRVIRLGKKCWKRRADERVRVGFRATVDGTIGEARDLSMGGGAFRVDSVHVYQVGQAVSVAVFASVPIGVRGEIVRLDPERSVIAVRWRDDTLTKETVADLLHYAVCCRRSSPACAAACI